jgi:hypothetical protein
VSRRIITLTKENWLKITSEINTFLENIAVIDYGISGQLQNAIVSELEKQVLFNELLLQQEVANERLKEENEKLNKMTGIFSARLCKKYEQTLQKIKVIAENLLEKGLEPQSIEHQLRLKGKRELASIILDLITEAEEK